MNVRYILKNLSRLCKNFGLRAMIEIELIPPLIRRDVHGRMEVTHVKRLSYMKRLLRHVIEEHRNEEIPCIAIDDNMCIYICWLQGEEMMPLIVKACYRSVLRHANGRKVYLITMENYKDFVSIPHFIEDRVTGKKISFTFFSDIIRNALLYQRGGIWRDATIYLTQDLHIGKLPFFSIRRNERWDYANISRQRWTSYFMAGVKGNPLNHFVLGGLIAYWAKKEIILDYFLMDYIICLGYENIPAITQMIDNLPYTNGKVFYLSGHLTQDRNSGDVLDVLRHTHIHKLTYKGLDGRYPTNSTYNGIIKNLF